MRGLRRPFTAIVAAFAFATLAPLVASAGDRDVEGAVTIRASGETMDGVGAGTIVARSGTTIRILTAKHVATFGALTVRFDDGTRVAAHLLSAMPERDLAIVEADVPTELAARLHAATIAAPHAQDAIHVWGSGLSGPAFEPGAVTRVGADMPDGAANGRYALACGLCHEGDSGGGVFDARGRLIGVYIGYFPMHVGRISVAESPLEAVRLAQALPYPTTIARNR